MAGTEKIERAFSVPDGCELDVSNIAGRITVVGVEGDQVRIVALKRWRSQRQAEATEIDIGKEGRRVWARTHVHRRHGWRWGRREAASVDYLIELPCQSQVKASSVSASTEVSAIEGQVSIKAVSGSVAVSDVTGSVSIESVSGDVSGQALRGQVHLQTVSGRADLADSDFTSLRAASVSGSLRIATNLHPTGKYKAQTVSGNVELLVPPTIKCTVEGHSISGRLRTTLAHTSQRQGFGRWRIEVGGGGVFLHFDSVSGDLILTAAEGETAVEPTVPEASDVTTHAESEAAPTAPTYSTAMGILRAIEAGELGVLEGAAFLKQLKGRQERQHGDQ